mgnify:FL=1
MNKKSKRILLLLGVLISVLLVVGVSYAVWRLYLSQTNTSKLLSTCFQMELTDQDDINLENSYPITDTEGKSLTPYQFTITNKCDGNAAYQVNLEIMNTSTLTNMDYIKVMLDESDPLIMSSYTETTPILSNTTKAYKIKTGTLGARESKSYNVRIWMDKNTPAIDEVMERLLEIKVSVNASYSTLTPDVTGAVETIASKVERSDDLTYDEAGNIRYIGANPNNYVSIDGELWRIIGVFNNIKSDVLDEHGETRIKLIRNEAIGGYTWDASTYNDGYGINEWSQADLMYLLNPGYTGINGSLYYNSSKGTCYVGYNNTTGSCDFITTGLKSSLKSLIDDALWNTGSNGVEALINEITTSKFYELERSNNTGKICTSGTLCNDPLGRTTTWVGKVGLMYPSDYGYATGGGNYKREYCLSQYLYTWTSYAECYKDDWLYNSGSGQWTLTPYAYARDGGDIFTIDISGIVNLAGGSVAALLVRPTVYLKSNVQILSGEGSSTDPYLLG